MREENMELIKRLEEEGARQRETDLSQNTVNETRRRVAHILAEKREADAERGILIPWFRSFDPMFKTAVAVIPVILGAVLVIMMSRDREVPPTSSELAMQNEIAKLSSSLRGGLSHFRRKYQSVPQISSFDVRRTKLKARIDRCFIELQKELTAGRVETVDNNSFINIPPGEVTGPTAFREIVYMDIFVGPVTRRRSTSYEGQIPPGV